MIEDDISELDVDEKEEKEKLQLCLNILKGEIDLLEGDIDMAQFHNAIIDIYGYSSAVTDDDWLLDLELEFYEFVSDDRGVPNLEE